VVDRRRSTVRTAVVHDAVRGVLQRRQDEVGHPLEVVDLGGGTGGMAVWVAGLGHRVTVVDPSPDALASLERRAADSGVSELVRGIQGDAATLVGLVGPATADVVICHGVLEVIEEPAQALRAAADTLQSGGYLSVLVAQRAAAVFARALAGHLVDAKTVLDDPAGSWGSGDPIPRRFNQAELEKLLGEAGFEVAEVRGVRVFTDHLSSAVVDTEPGQAEALLELEAAVATHPAFLPIAHQLHLLAVRS
jgi:S-adenosylmethionine-dependent methyltransferase